MTASAAINLTNYSENTSNTRPNFKVIPGGKNFTQILNAARENIIKNAGHIAFAIFEHMISKPLNWKFYPKEIASSCFCNRNTVYKYLNKLIDLGYIEREQFRDEITGKFKENIYRISQTPIYKKNTKTSQTLENQPRPSSQETDTILEKNIYNNTRQDNILNAKSVPQSKVKNKNFEKNSDPFVKEKTDYRDYKRYADFMKEKSEHFNKSHKAHKTNYDYSTENIEYRKNDLPRGNVQDFKKALNEKYERMLKLSKKHTVNVNPVEKIESQTVSEDASVNIAKLKERLKRNAANIYINPVCKYKPNRKYNPLSQFERVKILEDINARVKS